MRAIITLFLFVILYPLAAQTKGSVPTKYNQRADMEHFVLVWNENETKTEEIDEAKVYAEEVHGKLTQILGAANMPKDKLIVTFGGEGMDRARQKKRTPHVDFSGRIHLYRFDEGGYLSVLPHEMVHAIRMNNGRRWDGFFEEGFASAIAYHLYPGREGFPRFSYSLDLIAGYWLESGRGIPMETMRTQHNRLNLKCQLQTYVTREDFFNYLAVNYGMEKLVDFAYSNDVGTSGLYERIWGKSFKALASDWESDLRSRYQRLENTSALVDEYFKTTSAKYIPVCAAGIDY